MIDPHDDLGLLMDDSAPTSRRGKARDHIWTDILRRAKRRRRRRRALLAATGVMAAAFITYGGLQLYQYVAMGDSISIVDDPPVVTAAPTSSTSISTSSTTTALHLDEAALRAARDTVNHYFVAARTGAFDDFERLIAPRTSENASDAETLFAEEMSRLQDLGEEALAVQRMRPLIWTGSAYLLEPDVEMPSGLDAWIREDPGNRAVMETMMMDDSFRHIRVERQSPEGEWLVVP